MARAGAVPISPLYWMALGAFVIGVQGFMLPALLPDLAADLSVSIVAAGQLVTVFTLSYAISSPILTAVTGELARRRLLVLSMTAFAAANFFACVATNYWMLLWARILLAFAAGLYMPNAQALAGVVVEPARRGKALATVTAGTTVAVALGVPLSAVIGHAFGWRLTFAIIGVLALLATTGFVFGLAQDLGSGVPATTLGERVGAVRRKSVVVALVATTFWASGTYTIYTYLAVFLSQEAGVEASHIGTVLFLWGASAAVGVTTGGVLTDRLGARTAVVASLVLLASAFLSFSLCSYVMEPAAARIPILVAVSVWGFANWTFFPAQQARLIGLSGARLASIVISLNASLMFIGYSLGAVIGSIAMARLSPADLGWVGSLSEFASLLLVFIAARRGEAPAEREMRMPA
jgi:predicted MFS family arabinose efflux permease